jgi:hypothetical protein
MGKIEIAENIRKVDVYIETDYYEASYAGKLVRSQ